MIDKAIGVFDSGLGGISVLQELHQLLPQEHLIYYGDSAFAPYGVKDKQQITQRCFYIMDFLIQQGIKAIVIACNTATSACVNTLREAYPDLPIIGMEPALKLAAVGKSGQNILVMATAFTLKERKFYNLMTEYSQTNTIMKLPSPKLVEIVEQNHLYDHDLVEATLHEYLDAYDAANIDSIILGCTHFVYFKDKIRAMVNHDTNILDGNAGTARHVKDILVQQKKLVQDTQPGTVRFYNSSQDESYLERSKELFHLAKEFVR